MIQTAWLLLWIVLMNQGETQNPGNTNVLPKASNRLFSCCQTFYGVKYSNCSSVVDECWCGLRGEYLTCPKLNNSTLGVKYWRWSHGIHFACSTVNDSLNNIVQFVITFAKELRTTKVIFANCGNYTTPTTLSLSNLVNAQTINSLNLNFNFIQKITGNFAEDFRNLNELFLVENKIPELSDGIFDELSKLTHLRLSRNKLTNLHRYTFRGLRSLNILAMDYNQVEILPYDIFAELPNLKKFQAAYNALSDLPDNVFRPNNVPLELTDIILRGNRLNYLPSTIFHNMTSLLTLDLSHNRLKQISEDLFINLVSIKTLYLEFNELLEVPSNVFKKCQFLKYLYLHQNRLSSVPQLNFDSEKVQNPIVVDLSSNSITTLPHPLSRRLPFVDQVNLSNNCIKNVTKVDIVSTLDLIRQIITLVCLNCCLTSEHYMILEGISKYANLASNKISKIDMPFMKEAAWLELDLTGNLITTVNLSWEYPLTLMPNLNPNASLNIHDIPLLCDCHLIVFLQFVSNETYHPPGVNRSDLTFEFRDLNCAEPPNLKGIPITQVLEDYGKELICNLTTDCPLNCYCYFVGIREITIVDCFKKGLKDVPSDIQFANTHLNLSYNAIKSLPNKNLKFWSTLKELHLDNNELDSLENLNVTSQLEVIRLHNNNLRYLDFTATDIFRLNITVTLGGNPWVCNCNLQKLKALMISSGNVLDFRQMSCNVRDSGRLVQVMYATVVDLCPELIPQQLVIKVLLPVLASFVVLGSILTTVGCRYREELKLWLFVHGFCLRFVTEDDIDAQKQFDAFIAYSTNDEEWVARNLVEPLEKGVPSYSLLLHNRDWPGGEFIMEMILRSTQCSRRTIIVLTESFVESQWCRLEFTAAYQQAVADKINRVLVVVPEELPDVNKLGTELYTFITIITYIKWSDPHFWRKLRSAMPRVSHTSISQRIRVNDHDILLQTRHSVT